LHTICIGNDLKPSPRRGRSSGGDYDEFLAQAETEIDAEAFHETGLARFAAFNLQFLLTGHRYYVYSEELDAVSPLSSRRCERANTAKAGIDELPSYLSEG
jgi:hypothetical protein